MGDWSSGVCASGLFCAPAAVGVKRTVIGMPAAGTLNGAAGGETSVNAPPGGVSDDTIRVPAPLFVRVTVMVGLGVCPTVTLPKSRLGAETPIAGMLLVAGL